MLIASPLYSNFRNQALAGILAQIVAAFWVGIFFFWTIQTKTRKISMTTKFCSKFKAIFRHVLCHITNHFRRTVTRNKRRPTTLPPRATRQTCSSICLILGIELFLHHAARLNIQPLYTRAQNRVEHLSKAYEHEAAAPFRRVQTKANT